MTENMIRVGRRFLLNAGEETFLCKIEEVGRSNFRIAVPRQDFPMTDMKARLVFHDESGCTTFDSEVIQGPGPGNPSALLRMPVEGERVIHRDFTRVVSDLPVKFRSLGKVVYHEGRIANLSAGGMLFAADVEEPLKSIELSFSLPHRGEISCLAEVVHRIKSPEDDRNGVLYGCRFTGLEKRDVRAIIEFVWDVLERKQEAAS